MPNLVAIQKFVEKNFSHFGLNKKAQMIRLVYEIAKKEKMSFAAIFLLEKDRLKPFTVIKKELLSRRFPHLSDREKERWHFSPLKLQPKNKISVIKQKKFLPRDIFIEKDVRNAELVKNMKKKFPHARYHNISSYQHYVKDKKFSLCDYNRRLEKFFIVKEKYNFFVDCPCTKDAVCCGYKIMNCGFGCGFECQYCFLQSYTNAPGIMLQANLEDYFKEFKSFKNKNIRLGTGQFTDSLIFDDITNYAVEIVEFFRNYPQTRFEFKTKSKNIGGLLSIPSANNMIVSWSLNPQKIIDSTEFYTASLKERLACAEQCARHGYKIGFHFDPIVFYDGWEKDYQSVVKDIFKYVSPEKIAWISLGCLRMSPKQKEAIENRFVDNKILDGEFVLGFDNKLRYSSHLRQDIYRKMKEFILEHGKNIWVYLCMEDKEMTNKLGTH